MIILASRLSVPFVKVFSIKHVRASLDTSADADASTVDASATGGMDELESLARQLTDNVQRLVELIAQQHRALAEERDRVERAKRAILDA